VKILSIVLALAISGSCLAQTKCKFSDAPCDPAAKATLPDTPQPKPLSTRALFFADAGMFAGTLFNASGSRYGAARCIHEGDTRFIPRGPLTPWAEFGAALKKSLPIDGVILGASYLLHHKRHDRWAALLPITAGGIQVGIGMTQYSAGCF
jgi:hypothetical protein